MAEASLPLTVPLGQFGQGGRDQGGGAACREEPGEGAHGRHAGCSQVRPCSQSSAIAAHFEVQEAIVVLPGYQNPSCSMPAPNLPGGCVVEVSCMSTSASDIPTGPAIQGWWMITRTVTAHGQMEKPGARIRGKASQSANRTWQPRGGLQPERAGLPLAAACDGRGAPAPALTADDGGQDLASQEVAGLAHLGLKHSKDEHSCAGEGAGVDRSTPGERGLWPGGQACLTPCPALQGTRNLASSDLGSNPGRPARALEHPGTHRGNPALTRSAKAAHHKRNVNLGRGPLVEHTDGQDACGQDSRPAGR